MFKKLKFSFSVLFIFLFAINAFANTVFQGNVVIIGNLQVINQFSGFVTEWTVAGDATARTITLPLYNSGTFNCVVDWGDGTTSTITAYNSANRIHTYATDGVYYVAITGNCPSWSFNNTGDKLKITAIKQWGDINFSGFKYLSKGFYGCSNLTSLGIGKIKVYDTTLTILQFCFDGTKITSIPSGLFDNCVNVTDFVSVFQSCTSLTSIPTDLFRYNTSAYIFENTFNSCSNLQVKDNIFYADGEQSTRFLNKSAYFTNCFYRTTFTGTQGTVPDLWNCDFGTGTPTKTGCFGGAGNTATSISNFADIPAAWR